MTIPLRALAEINHDAIRILSREIGLANTIRFINQFTTGMGDYTAERREMFADMSLDDIVSEMKRRKA